MNSYKYFVGLDLGKTTNAICVLDEQENRCFELKLPNTQQGMQTLLEKLQTLDHFEPASVLICAEYTGVYCQTMIGIFGSFGADLWLQ